MTQKKKKVVAIIIFRHLYQNLLLNKLRRAAWPRLRTGFNLIMTPCSFLSLNLSNLI
jgi:hypothetical protein